MTKPISITAAELIDLLSKCPPDTPVMVGEAYDQGDPSPFDIIARPIHIGFGPMHIGLVRAKKSWPHMNQWLQVDDKEAAQQILVIGRVDLTALVEEAQ